MSRVLNAELNNGETQDDIKLRPATLDDYVGQEQLKENLKVFIGAALKRDETLDHVLFYGPPGLGKTSLAFIIANEMHSKIHVTSAPAIEKTGDLAAILNELNPGDILFIDEIHRLPRVVEESLYSAMEDFELSIIINKESGPKVLKLSLPPFTLVGATTRSGSLSSPLRARFGYIEKLNFYTEEELAKIVARTAKVFGCSITNDASFEIAKRSRGTPRIANRIFKRVRDFADYNSTKDITKDLALQAVTKLKIDKIGLDNVDIKYLETLINRFQGGPVGLDTLADAIGEDKANLEDIYEPYLIKIGMINRTPKGRLASALAYEHLGIEFERI